MVFPQCTAKTTYIHDLLDEPVQTSQEIRDLLDQSSEEIVGYLNGSFKTYIEGIETQADNIKTKTDGATTEEITRLHGLTSSAQEQLNAKQSLITYGTTAPTSLATGQIYIRYKA